MASFAGTRKVGNRVAKGSIEALLLLKPPHRSGKSANTPSPFNDTLQKDAHRLIKMMNYELQILLISTTHVAKILVAFVIAYDFMICHEYKIVGMNPFQRFKDDVTLKPASDTSLAKLDSVIPSIHTFLEDTKILAPCAKIMKKLLPSVCRTSIFQEFSRLHNGQTSWSLQTSEVSAFQREEFSSDTAHRNAYRQLWLYTIRHFPEMIGCSLRKDHPREKPPLLGVELIWWYRFTALAEACGYTDVDKTCHRGNEADYKMAQTFLQQARPPQLYGTSTASGNSVQQMVELLGKDHSLLSGNAADIDRTPAMDWRFTDYS